MARARRLWICTPGLAPCEDLSCGVCMPRRKFGCAESGLPHAPPTTDLSSQAEAGQKVSGSSHAPTSLTSLPPKGSSNSKASSHSCESCEKISLNLQVRIARARNEEPDPSLIPKKRAIFRGALEYIYALRHRLRGQSSPAPRAGTWSPHLVKAELQEIIPERLIKKGEANAVGRCRKKGRIRLLYAVDLYLDELESEVTGFKEEDSPPQEPYEEEWNGFSEIDIAQHQPDVRQGSVNLEQARRGQTRSLETFEEGLEVYQTTAEDCRLRIGNIALKTTEAELAEFLSDYGVRTICILPGKKSEGLASALLSLWNADEAKKAMSELSGKELLGRKISVCRARGMEYLPTAEIARKKRKSLIKMSRAGALEDEATLTGAHAEARNISEAQVENALLKIEQWCDLWLSGRIPEDQWHTLDDCLDLG